MKKRQKIIVILGPTATGKSDLAVEIAKEIKGEIISCDSRQVYRGMNLGTGKITKKEMHSIPHHMLDIVSPHTIFSVADFKKKAEKKIDEIIKKGRIPILCGGTGLYIDTLLGEVTLPEVPPNTKLRKELECKTVGELFEKLQKLDPARASTIDSKNKVRLIRALEIVDTLGSVPAQKPTGPSCLDKYNVLKIGLDLPDEVLKEKIQKRLISRIKKGMIKEIKNLKDQGISWKRLEMLGLEYRYGAMYLQHKITKDEMIDRLNSEIWHYAKRQRTWFKRDKSTMWIDPRDEEKVEEIKNNFISN